MFLSKSYFMVENGVLEYFDVSADLFDKKRGSSVKTVENVEESWASKNLKFSKSDVVLDFACGTGRWTKRVHKKVKRVVAVDAARKPLQSLKEQRFSNVIVVHGSHDVLKKYKSTFSKILFAQALEFYKNPLPLLRLMRESIQKDGELFITTWTPKLINRVDSKAHKVIAKSIDGKKEVEVFCRFRTKKEIRELLKKTGFKNIKVEGISIPVPKLTKNYQKALKGKREVEILLIATAKN